MSSLAAKAQAQSHLQTLFPNIDLVYLSAALDFQIKYHARPEEPSDAKGKGKESVSGGIGAAELVERATTKLVELNKGEYPTVVRKPRRVGRSRGEVANVDAVKKTWESAKGDTGGRSRMGGKDARSEGLMVQDDIMTKNLALIRLHVLFPHVPIVELRRVLSSLDSRYLFEATEYFLKQTRPLPANDKPDIPLPSFFTSIFGRSTKALNDVSMPKLIPALLPTDLFRSADYTESLVKHLQHTYPQVPVTAIRSIVADGGSYAESRTQVELWRVRQNKVKIWFRDIFSSPSALVLIDRKEVIDDAELRKEVWNFGAVGREEVLKEDNAFAAKLNRKWTVNESKYTCGCCFDDSVTFEDVGFCSWGEHSFCKECIARQVEEQVFGGAPLRILVERDKDETRIGEGTGIRCLSTEGCLSPFSHRELERVLSPTLFSSLSRRLAEFALESIARDQILASDSESLRQCPFCLYSKIVDGSVLTKAFPCCTGYQLGKLKLKDFLGAALVDISSLFVLLPFYFIALVAVFWFPNSFYPRYSPATNFPSAAQTSDKEAPGQLFPILEPIKAILVAHQVVRTCAQKVLAKSKGQRNVFQCRNGPSHSALPKFGDGLDPENGTDSFDLIQQIWPNYHSAPVPSAGNGEKGTSRKLVEGTCGRLSCLTCKRVWVEGREHQCYENEKEGMRLAVEKAIDDAVKRKCPACGVSFLKDKGCNKVVCRCGYAQCYTCRKDIGKESYSHFCDHFRAVHGSPCQTCDKCNLWQTLDEDIVIKAAAAKARQDWLVEHPTTSLEVANQRIGPVAERSGIVVERVREYIEIGLKLSGILSGL